MAAAVVIVPVVGAWFEELAREQGLYEHPTARVMSIVDWFAILAHSPLYGWIGGCVVGMVLGLWADIVLRRVQGLHDWHSYNQIYDLVPMPIHELAQKTGNWVPAMEYIYEKLRNGAFISRGKFLRSTTLEAIPAAHWRFLKISDDYTRAEGGGLSYAGISVAKK